jgi:hypothetical protein
VDAVGAGGADVVAVHIMEASAQESVVARESTVILVTDVDDRATLADKEARERVSRLVAESVMPLASAQEVVESFTQSVALLEGALAELRQA